MDREQVRALLDDVATGGTSTTAALDRLATAPYDALGHSLVDLHRGLRTGDPEVVYGAGKTTAQVLDVVAALRASSDRAVLATRCKPETVAALLRRRLAPDGLTLRQNTGAASGQQVPHLHLHLVPRWHGDGTIGWPWPPPADPDLPGLLARLLGAPPQEHATRR